MNTNRMRTKLKEVNEKFEGRILPPLILWMLGVPGIVVIVLWMFFFRD